MQRRSATNPCKQHLRQYKKDVRVKATTCIRYGRNTPTRIKLKV